MSITQGERRIFEGLVRTAAEAPGLVHDVSTFPEVQKPDALRFIQELVPGEEPTYAFWKNYEVKPVWPERFTEPRDTRYPPLFREWYRFTPRAQFDDPWLDAARALMMIDTASWIAASAPHRGEPYIAPNLDVTAWFHRPVRSAWLLIDARCDVADDGLMGTHARVWGEDGALVATGGAQLLCAPAPS